MSVRDGVELAKARLRQPGTALACALTLAFELGVALLERAQGHAGAADRALEGGAFGLALPLLSYFLVTRVCADDNLREAVWPLARHGLNSRLLALGLALPAAALASAVGVLGGIIVVLATRGFADEGLLADLAASSWIGAVAGAVYVAALLGASALGARGRGRVWLLALDFLLGAGSSSLALPWPKGHVRNLLGGAPVLELSQLAALGVLLGTSFALLSFGLRRNDP